MSIIKLVTGPVGADECWALERYGVLRRYMVSAKFYGNAAATAALCHGLAGALTESIPVWSRVRDASAVVATPSHWRLSRRAAGAMATTLGCSSDPALTWSCCPPIPLKTIPASQRAEVIANTMTARTIAGTVLIIDDTVDSTATFSEASRALRAAGADHIVCVALARV